MRPAIVLVLAVGLVLGSFAQSNAQSTASWVMLRPISSPPARESHAMAYDNDRGNLVLFGGRGSNEIFDDTWVWDGETWQYILPVAQPPSPRIDHAMVFDAARHRVLLFGGYSSITTTGWLNDTWEWDGEKWTMLTPAHSPEPRSRHAMAYDSQRQRVVLFGGRGAGRLPNDTWEWDGQDWSRLSPPESPSQREQPGLAYDEGRGVTLLFGGRGGCGSAFCSDTWAWDGMTWEQLQPETRAEGSDSPVMAFDKQRRRVVMFGRVSAHEARTWEWDGADWSERTSAVSPQPAIGTALAYDTRRHQMILFGGVIPTGILGDTWEYQGVDTFLRRIYLPMVLNLAP